MTKNHSHYDTARLSGWRSNFGMFGNYGGMTTAHDCLSGTQFPANNCPCNVGAAAAAQQSPIVAGSASAGTVGSGTTAPTGTGM